MQEATANRLINILTAALGAGVAWVGVHYHNDMLMMAGATVFGAALKQPGTLVKRQPIPTHPPEAQ